jgi:hypothetical protein
MIDYSKLGCGPLHMIKQAIYDHKVKYMGRRPLRIEIHPEIAYDLINQLRDVYHLVDLVDLSFDNVPIMVDEIYINPVLIDFRGKPVSL